MIEETTERGFQVVAHEKYPPDGKLVRAVGQSSAIGDYEDSLGKPGSSYLWVGDNLHLNREEVERLRHYLSEWLASGKLF